MARVANYQVLGDHLETDENRLQSVWMLFIHDPLLHLDSLYLLLVVSTVWW